MRILVVGSGGREHALVWKIAQSPLVSEIYCAPGNAGIGQQAVCIPISATDIDALLQFALQNRIDLTVVGPEAPLIAGITDRFVAHGLRVFGPTAAAAQIEGSKSFAKQLMQEAGIPTAAYRSCGSLAEAQAYLNAYYTTHSSEKPIVLKADGLAAGKGVLIAESRIEAEAGLQRIMADRVFGASGDRVVIEEYLLGEEASIMVLTDGTTVVPFAPSQDHKRIFDGDLGPNTGGMGAYAPVPHLPADLVSTVVAQVVQPAVDTMRQRGTPYCGVLYAGIMVTEAGPKTIEFNCRFGDPETQAVLPLLESDLVPLFLAATEGTLHNVETYYHEGAATCVVAASAGYPDNYPVGLPIHGLDTDTELVFHAGTRLQDGQVVTAGGRVLSVTGLGANVEEATQQAYARLAHIDFAGIQYRHDIAKRAFRS